jgi:hypothetical protein
MFTAYLDESGLEKRGVVRVGGFIGKKEQWDKLAEEWPKGFEGSQRKALHMKTMRFKYESEKRLLARLGPIPQDCGLRRIAGSVDVRDYYDLVEGTVGEIHAQGYAIAIWPLVKAIANVIPSSESFKLVFEQQDALGFYRDKWLEFVRFSLSHPPPEARHKKRPQLISWETIAKGESCLCEPADYLCYHLAQKAEDPLSIQTLWTAPIMGNNGSIWKEHISRDLVRWFYSNMPEMDRQDPKQLSVWRKYIRQGGFDPWKAVLDKQKKARAK